MLIGALLRNGEAFDIPFGDIGVNGGAGKVKVEATGAGEELSGRAPLEALELPLGAQHKDGYHAIPIVGRQLQHVVDDQVGGGVALDGVLGFGPLDGQAVAGGRARRWQVLAFFQKLLDVGQGEQTGSCCWYNDDRRA